MNWVALVVLLALIEYFALGALVGRARGKYAIAAPAVSGHPLFERYFRVHQNSLEQLIVFIPAVWLFGLYVSALWAAIVGAVFLAARILYAVGYIAAPERREAGAVLSGITEAVLMIGAVVGVLRSIVA
ncbi:MAG TPA: MAPEG family protein [Steroidobacteraceae bacterium]